MNILALEPYYGGSHRAFLDGWSERSEHSWTILGLPAYKWKWRMRHAAITMADEIAAGRDNGARWDALWCSDMLNLAELLGLAPTIAELPRVAYFHENQLTYCGPVVEPRDYHFAFTNLTTALAADAVWFNSEFHRRSFLTEARRLMRRMPDYQPIDAVDRIAAKATVQPPGTTAANPPAARRPGPLRILWAARWEHDKDPDTFFAALKLLRQRDVAFRLSVLGESFDNVPEVFEQAREAFADRIDHWGYVESRHDYWEALRQADVIVSTARHEFFGIAVAEAVTAGAVPLVPNKLAYPELLDAVANADRSPCFHDGTAHSVAERLERWARMIATEHSLGGLQDAAVAAVSRFNWERRAAELDQALAGVIAQRRPTR